MNKEYDFKRNEMKEKNPPKSSAIKLDISKISAIKRDHKCLCGAYMRVHITFIRDH